MAGQRSRTWLVAATLGTLAIAVFAAVSIGAVNVYKNNFSVRSEFGAIRPAGEAGKCERSWSRKRKLMRALAKQGPKACRYRPPVQSDAAQANYTIVIQAKVSKETKAAIREEAYVGIAARVGDGREYELRVFPRESRFVLRREPDDGAFPVEGPDPAVKGIGDLNTLRLDVNGADVKAQVNGATVANVTDGSPGQIDGTKLEFRLGSTASTNKDTHGAFDGIKVIVPDP